MSTKKLLNERTVPQRRVAVRKTTSLRKSIARLAKATKTDGGKLYAAVSRRASVAADKASRRRATAQPNVTSAVNRVCRRLGAQSIDEAVRRIAEDIIDDAGDVDISTDDLLTKAAKRVADAAAAITSDPEVKARVVAEAVSPASVRAVAKALSASQVKSRQAKLVASAKSRFAARRAARRMLRRSADGNTYVFQTPYSLTLECEEFDYQERNVTVVQNAVIDEVIETFNAAYADDKDLLSDILGKEVRGATLDDAVIDANGFVTWTVTADRALSDEEIDVVEDFIAGQCSDGFGEGLEQQLASTFDDEFYIEVPEDEDDPDAGTVEEVAMGTVEVFLNLWTSKGWSIKRI